MSNEVQAAVIETLAEGMTVVYRTNVADAEGKTLKGLQQAVGGYVDAIDVRHPVTGEAGTLWINDEGKMNGSPMNEYATILAVIGGWAGPAYGDYVAGTAVLTGYDPETGETVPMSDAWMEVIASIA